MEGGETKNATDECDRNCCEEGEKEREDIKMNTKLRWRLKCVRSTRL
jgi:hypothetical protein